MINNSIIIGVIVGIMVYIIIYFYNKYYKKYNNEKANKNIDIIPIIIITIVVCWVHYKYNDEQLNIDNILDINTILCK